MSNQPVSGQYGWVHHQNFKRLALATGIGFSLLTGTAIYFSSSSPPDWTIKDWNHVLFDVLKGSFSFLAGMTALLALWVSNFRAAQQQRQIETAEAQNNFTNYYKHREHLAEQLADIKPRSEDNPSSIAGKFQVNTVHSRVFPNTKTGDLLCTEFYQEVHCFNERIYGVGRIINEYQENLTHEKTSKVEFSSHLQETHREIRRQMIVFCAHYGIGLDFPTEYSVIAASKAEQAIVTLQAEWQQLTEIFCTVIGCAFSSESAAQQTELRKQSKRLVWDTNRYNQLIDPNYKTFEQTFSSE